MIYAARITAFGMAILLSFSLAATAAELTIPNSFSNGTAADADQVNANFEAVKKAVNENNLKDGGVVNGPLTVPAVTFSAPKSGVVTYSAMGFSPVNNNIKFEKDIYDGSLSVSDFGQFYHSITLCSGVTITHIRAHIKDESAGAQVTVDLKKKELGQDPKTLVSLNTNVSTGDPEQVFEKDLENPESIEWSQTGPLPTYYIEVLLNGKDVYLYSVTLDYEYTEP